MAQVISRLYDSSKQLAALENDLKTNDFAYAVVIGSQSGKSASADGIVAAMQQAHVSGGDAEAYAEFVKKGGVVVVVQAAFGRGAIAIAILDGYSPNAISMGKSTSSASDIGTATPFSNILHVPVLTSGPFKPHSGDWLLVDSDKTFSGRPLVITSTGPYQSFSGKPLLLNSSGPYKSFSGTPLLLNTSGPYKSYSGVPLLINNPTLLSSWLGLPVLSKRK
jgi:hypothetical protein